MALQGPRHDRHGRDDQDGHQEHYDSFRKDKKQMIMNELNEKRDLLYQMDRLESKGYRLPFKFNMDDFDMIIMPPFQTQDLIKITSI